MSDIHTSLATFGAIAFSMIGILGFLASRRIAIVKEMKEELSVENIVLGPTAGFYSQKWGKFSGLQLLSVIAFTEKQLVIRNVIGKTIRIPTEDIASIKPQRVYRGMHSAIEDHIIIETIANERIRMLIPVTAQWAQQAGCLYEKNNGVPE